MRFQLTTDLRLTSDQQRAAETLTKGIASGFKNQVLLGVTGSGKTFTVASVIERVQKPTLVISHNKTLAAQLYQEFKEFFPENAVHYFVSYYDYYQPEAYIPQTDTYIEKDAKINDEIDRLRHAATQSIRTRPDTIVVASVSCIYGIGDPEEYEKVALEIKKGEHVSRKKIIEKLVELQYARDNILAVPGSFRTRGEQVEIAPITGDNIIRIALRENEIESITRAHPLTGETTSHTDAIQIFPAKHFVTPQEKLERALKNISRELEERLEDFKKAGKLLEAQRIETRTRFDIEMMRETGYCAGIENYSRHLSFRKPGTPPSTLLDYFSFDPFRLRSRQAAQDKPKDFLLVIDESHMTIPQIRGMYNGDRARKEILVAHGFRLPSALDNRPLTFEEFNALRGETLYTSATPGPYELGETRTHIVEQLTRPTGILDPPVEIHPTKGQVEHLIRRIRERTARKERVLVTVLTKRLAEDLTEFLLKENIQVQYLHSEIKTLERPEILRDLRLGTYDVIVGVNLLREGLDLPEVSLVAILDADKEGFLRNDTTLIQTMGRAARHTNGQIIMYADTTTQSMKRAIRETDRRRAYQKAHNNRYGIVPTPIKKDVRAPIVEKGEGGIKEGFKKMTFKELQKEMKKAAESLEFERAAEIRNMIKKLVTS